MHGWWEQLVYAALAGGAFAPWEWLRPERDDHDGRMGWQIDLAFATVGAILTHALMAVAVGATLATAARIEPWDPGLPTWASVALGILVFEALGYGYHRAAHVVPALWRFHAVHHSADRMYWLASFRQHPVEIVLVTLVQNVPLVLLGISLGEHAVVVVSIRLGTVYVHSNVRVDVPLLRWLVATPRFHHRHHDRDAPAANFAALLPVFDRLFGTYSPARARAFGLVEAVPRSFLGLVVHPFRRAATAIKSGGATHV